MDAIGALTNELNPLVVYIPVAVATLLSILRKVGVLALPRTFSLICWYFVVALALIWTLFFGIYIFTHEDGSSRLVAFALIISFVPVYLCALILLFMYPKKEKTG